MDVAENVLHSQGNFRAILDALARPGSMSGLVSTSQDAPMNGEFVSGLLTLCDHDTPIWLSPALRTQEVADFIGFHTGAPLVDEPAKATFAFVDNAQALPKLSAFNLGTQEYPDRSTAIVLKVAAFKGRQELMLRGPGIKDHRHIAPQGLPPDFVAQWAENRALFPRGVDMLLVCDGQVMGLPRTVRIGEGH
jgi:alpha-D-ribose 1-methylphosphonate 5-triphosphate synthase subunit PhnH